MRTLLIAIPVSLLLAAPLACAQSSDYPKTDSSTSTVQVTAPPPAFYLYDSEADAVRGRYAMSNGWRLNVQTDRASIVAQIDKQHPMRLMAVSADKFVSRDGNVEMVFNRGPYGDGMTMSYVPNSNLAQLIVVTATVASR